MYEVLFPNQSLICSYLAYVTLPEPPTDVHATEINHTYIVLSWKPPIPRGRASVWYLVEKVCECVYRTSAVV